MNRELDTILTRIGEAYKEKIGAGARQAHARLAGELGVGAGGLVLVARPDLVGARVSRRELPLVVARAGLVPREGEAEALARGAAGP